jgi:hypothetical protein
VYDAHASDGIVEFKTDAKYDAVAQKKMDTKVESDMGYRGVGGDGKTCDNCTSYVETVIPRGKGETVSATVTIDVGTTKVDFEAPTELFKSASKLKGATILKGIPADLKNKSFLDAYYSPSPGGKSNKKK